MNTEISRTLLDWYAANARRLPWRGHPDAYAVWVSEIMLQQTRVETVIPYFERWMQRFPTVQALAEASQQEVLQTWEGLGYYSRARNLHQAAQKLVMEYGGALPQSRQELEKLPGIGRYTAGAIASMAFGQDEAALDGNIRRVLSRLFAMRLPARSPQGEKRLWETGGGKPAARPGRGLQPGVDGPGDGDLHPTAPCLPALPTGGTVPGTRRGHPGGAARAGSESPGAAHHGHGGDHPTGWQGAAGAAAIQTACWAGCGNSRAANKSRVRICQRL